MEPSEIDTLYIVGPTASGKTDLAVDVAISYGAEIVCADSQTVRKGLDIGTAKPTIEERKGIVHHLLDIVEPYDRFTVREFQTLARRAIENIHHRRKMAIVVGGTGLYVDSLYFNYEFPLFEASTDLDSLDTEALQDLIQEKGLKLPENSRNKRHLINTLYRNGAQGSKRKPDPNSTIVGINPGKAIIEKRISDRIEKMYQMSLLDEVRKIINQYGRPPRDFDAIGYRIAMRYLDGDITEEKSRELFKIADRQYAKRQITWFKRNAHITWFDHSEAARKHIDGILNS